MHKWAVCGWGLSDVNVILIVRFPYVIIATFINIFTLGWLTNEEKGALYHWIYNAPNLCRTPVGARGLRPRPAVCSRLGVVCFLWKGEGKSQVF